MKKEQFISLVRNFFEEQEEIGKQIKKYWFKESFQEDIKDLNIKVALNKYKDVILEEETQIELGGFGKESFSLVYLIEDDELIRDGHITILGPELNSESNKQLDFGIFLFISVRRLTESTYRELNSFNFISNGIKGFSIRTIPRRFWCRISYDLMEKKFNLEIFGNAIIQLYKSKFKETINSMELFFINSDREAIEKFLSLTSQVTLEFKEKWKKKVDEWKKRVDCEYDWGCEICPYQIECQDVKELLNTRNKLES